MVPWTFCTRTYLCISDCFYQDFWAICSVSDNTGAHKGKESFRPEVPTLNPLTYRVFQGEKCIVKLWELAKTSFREVKPPLPFARILSPTPMLTKGFHFYEKWPPSHISLDWDPGLQLLSSSDLALILKMEVTGNKQAKPKIKQTNTQTLSLIYQAHYI